MDQTRETMIREAYARAKGRWDPSLHPVFNFVPPWPISLDEILAGVSNDVLTASIERVGETHYRIVCDGIVLEQHELRPDALGLAIVRGWR